MATMSARTEDGISFGPFTLLVSERLLTKEGVPDRETSVPDASHVDDSAKPDRSSASTSDIEAP